MTNHIHSEPKFVRPFSIRPSTDGCDETFEIFCRATGRCVATFNYWEQRDSALRHARQFMAALNMFYRHGGNLCLEEFVGVHKRLSIEHCGWRRCREELTPVLPTEPEPLTPYDAYEVHGIYGSEIELDDTINDDFAKRWAIFGHVSGNGLERIADFATRAEAEAICTRITGSPYSTPTVQEAFNA